MIKKIRGNFPNIESYDKFRRNTPLLIANEVKNHFLDGFQKGGGQTDKSVRGWQPRQRGSVRNNGRNVLVDTGQLRRDVKKRVVNIRKIIVGTRSVPYGIYHNDGTEKMPQREFIGDSKELDRKVIKIINTEMQKTLK